MSLVRAFLFVLASIVFAASTAHAQASFNTRASHVVILDHETGEVLFGKNADEPMPPASMSKLMTALMAFEALESGQLTLSTELPVSEDAWRRGGAASGSSTMFLEVNSRASVEDLLRGIIIQSGNDACIVLAEAIGGTEANFADMMTERAHELGFTSAQFANSTGWPDPNHRISAADLARLAQYMIDAFPQYFALYAEEEYTYNGIRQFNRNPLLGVFEGADGLKTGHTEESGYGLVATAVRDGVRRIVVFNGMESSRARADEAERLMRAAFSEFELVNIVEANQKVADVEVLLGQSSQVELVATEALRVGVHRRDADDINAELVYTGPLRAPISAGESIGHLEVSLADGRSYEVDVAAANSVEQKGLFGRAGDAFVRLIRGS